MENTPISFKQVREFGEIFNVTFAFIQQEYKKLGMSLIYFVLPILILASIFTVFMGIEQQTIMRSMGGGQSYPMSNPFFYLKDMIGYLSIGMILYAVGLTSLKCTVLGYIKLYNEKGHNNFGLNDIWMQIKEQFFPVLGTSIVIGLVIMVGFVLCIIPGIYLGISLCLIFIILVYEGKGFGSAFSRSFDLIKQNWWVTFGLVVVAYLMIYMVMMIFSIPAIILGLKPLFTNLKNLENVGSFSFPTSYYILNSISYLIGYFLMSVPTIILAFHYFSLVEQKEKPSLQDKINQISDNV